MSLTIPVMLLLMLDRAVGCAGINFGRSFQTRPQTHRSVQRALDRDEPCRSMWHRQCCQSALVLGHEEMVHTLPTVFLSTGEVILEQKMKSGQQFWEENLHITETDDAVQEELSTTRAQNTFPS